MAIQGVHGEGSQVSGVLAALGQANGNGWLYDLLTKSGVDPNTAHTVNELVISPLEVLLVIVGAILAAHFGAKIIRRAFRRVAQPAAGRLGSPRATARAETVVALVANLWRFVVVVVAIAIILSMFGINLTPLLASATVLGATIGFGAQALVRDYLSGVLLTVEDQYGIGDSVWLPNATGTDTTGVVEDLSLRVTRIRDADGVVWFIPNGDIRRLGNTSRGWVQATVDLPIAASGPEDLDRAKDQILRAGTAAVRSPAFAGASGTPRLIGITEATDTACTLRIAVQTTAQKQTEVECALREACLRALMTTGLWNVPSGSGGR